jgi:hypothetical protein
MTFKQNLCALVVFIAAVAGVLAASAASAETSRAKVTAAIQTIKVLKRPGRDTLAAAWDGDKYIQCRHMSDQTLRCEAGGATMQSSLAHVLTPDRIGRLAAMGWMFDPHFGNYVQTFKSDVSAGDVADKIIAALAQGYAADVTKLEVETTSIESEPCPPRNGPSQNLAGLISEAPSMASTAIHACAYTPDADAPAHVLPPGSTVSDLIKLYGGTAAAEIRRLRVNMHRDQVFVVFDVGIGYVQCQPDTDPDAFYCEAQSAESWPALAAVLTPDRIARLHALGFADPGRAQNYAKTYPADKFDDDAVADEVLTVLHDAYGYYGAIKLEVKTEEDK